MSLNSTRALWRGIRAQPAVFERTPNWGLVTGQPGRDQSVYRPRGDWLVLPEIALAGLNTCSVVMAWHAHNPGIVVNAGLLAVGLAVVAVSTIWEMRLQFATQKFDKTHARRYTVERIG